MKSKIKQVYNTIGITYILWITQLQTIMKRIRTLVVKKNVYRQTYVLNTIIEQELSEILVFWVILFVQIVSCSIAKT